MKVEGADDLIRKLNALVAKDAKAACRKGLREGAKVIQAEAKNNAPVRSGLLKKAIKVRAANKGKKIGVAVQTKTEDVYWGRFVELGTRFQRAQHYLEKAAKSEGNRAMDTTLKRIDQEIQKAATK